MAGYNAARAACLSTGSSDRGRRWLDAPTITDSAYIAGYEWALWDYDDANGMPKPLRRKRSAP